jgi:hypothetical protein
VSNDLERSEDLFWDFLAIQVFFDLLKGNLGIFVRFLRRSRRILCLDGKLRDGKSVNLGGLLFNIVFCYLIVSFHSPNHLGSLLTILVPY